MNQMVANLYVNKTGTSSSTQGSTNVQMETSSKPGDEQQTKRKQSSEKSMKKVKRKRPTEESSLSNDIDGRIIFSYFHIILNSIPQVLMLNIRQQHLKIFLHRIYLKKYDTISIEYNRFI